MGKDCQGDAGRKPAFRAGDAAGAAVRAAPVGQPRLIDADIAAEVERLQLKREERAAIKQTRLRK